MNPAPLSPHAASEFRSILVVRQHNQLGDMLCVTPLLHALRRRYPSAFMALLTSPVNHEVMLHHRALDAVIEFDKRAFLTGGKLHPAAFVRFVRGLRKHGFDLALVPSTVSVSGTSDLLAYCSGAKVRIGAGTLEGCRNRTSFLLTHRLDLRWEPDRHQTERNLDAARGLSLPDVPHSIDMTLQEEEIAWGRAYVKGLVPDRSPVLLYHVGAGKPPNRWPAERFADVINRMGAVTGSAAILLCGPMDEEAVRAVESMLHVRCYRIHSQPIRRVASIVAAGSLLVSNDTGIMHVGAAVGTPVLSLFGPTPPEQWAPRGPIHRYIQGEGGSMNGIQTEEVLRHMGEMLRQGGQHVSGGIT